MMRWIALALGILVLLWLPVEDIDLRMVVALATMIGIWATMKTFKGVFTRRKSILVWHVVAGFVGGAAMMPIALVLMAVKTGLHGHETPDYTLGQIRYIIALTPIWVVAGGFVGLGVGMLRMVVAARSPRDRNFKY